MNLDSSMGESLWAHAEQNSEDFAIALSLVDSYKDYTGTLIQDFSIAINEELRRKLKEQQDKSFLVEFTVSDDAAVLEGCLKRELLSCGLLSRGQNIFLGISSDKLFMNACYWGCWVYDNGDVKRITDELGSCFGGQAGSGTCAWWNWFRDVDDTKNWQSPRAVKRMAKALRRQGADKDTSFLDIFVDTLISVALIAEKHMKK